MAFAPTWIPASPARVESEREKRWLEWCALVYRKKLAGEAKVS